ncbi:DUF998 domain-containing protein [Aeoliella sp. ICT_H6.2]|uniref:DUF998 domain-containing protein n=1 Tax=Aeoliella straminimaris TaxID=2954799 RepID=A0A9X2JGT1_9BACT|nr:DUF998 domain-containing protein [Aeoliella straminimaris]MCO6045071.1 DUF998 domain-containing protein [Aeoliella straminimaris]
MKLPGSKQPRLSRPLWTSLFGWVAVLGSVVVLLSDFVGCVVVEDHNPISETISKLAVGEYGWVQDVGLDVFAAGVIATAIGLLVWQWGGIRWRIGVVALVLTAITVLVIAEYDEYKGFDGFGVDIHLACVYILYVVVAVAAVTLGLELRPVGRGYRTASFVFAAVWLVGSPIFMFAAPTSIDGAIERFLAVCLVAWISMLAWLLIRKGQRRPGEWGEGEA